ncbi:MAG: hypothetical protein JWQ75_3000, partial [Pseudarthrobacter sp.]|nr:hypothetical protein [Pseudarthrobacter sp.]
MSWRTWALLRRGRGLFGGAGWAYAAYAAVWGQRTSERAI